MPPQIVYGITGIGLNYCDESIENAVYGQTRATNERIVIPFNEIYSFMRTVRN